MQLLSVMFVVLFASPQDKDKAQQPSKDEAVIESLRKTPMTIDLPQGTLAEFVQQVRDFTGLNIVAVGVDTPPEPISATYTKVPVETILELTLEPYGLMYIVEDGIVQIVPKSIGESRTTLEIYDVEDITYALQDFPGPTPDASGALTQSEEGWAVQFTAEQLQTLITDSIDKGNWEAPGHTITNNQGMLIIRTLPGTHAQIRRLLDGFRKMTRTTDSIEVHLVALAWKDAVDLPLGPLAPEEFSRLVPKLLAPSAIRQHLSLAAANTQRVNGIAGPVDASKAGGEDRLVVDVRPIEIQAERASIVEYRVTGMAMGESFRVMSTSRIPWGGANVVALGRAPGSETDGLYLVIQDRVRSEASPAELMSPERGDVCVLEEKIPNPDAKLREIQDRFESQTMNVFEVNNETLESAIGQIKDAIHMDIVLGKDAREGHKNADISLRLTKCSVKSILKILLGDKGLTLVYHKGVLVVTDRKAVETRAVTSMLDARDMFFSIKAFPAPTLQFVKSEGVENPTTGAVFEVRDESESTCISQDFLTEIIKTMTGGGRWDENPNAGIQMVNGLLIVSQTERVLNEVKDLMSLLRRTQSNEGVTLRLTYFEADAATTEKISKGAFPVRLGRDAANEALAALKTGRIVDDISVSCTNTQRAHTLVQRPSPTKEAAAGGLVADMHPTVSKSGDELIVEMRSTLARTEGGELSVASFECTDSFPMEGGEARILGTRKTEKGEAVNLILLIRAAVRR